MDKYASNVVDTCISLARKEERQQACQNICEMQSNDLLTFCTHQSANYVFQELMNSASPEQMDTIYIKVSPHFAELRHFVWARAIIGKLESRRNYRMTNLHTNLQVVFQHAFPQLRI